MQPAYLLSNVILTIIMVWRAIRVIIGQFRVMRGHMIQISKMFVTFDVLRCSAFFWHTSCICSKMLSFEVIRSQWRSARGQSFDLKLTWPYFLCNIAVFSFPLICDMPIFLVIAMLTIIEVWRRSIRSLDPEQQNFCNTWYPEMVSFLLIYIMYTYVLNF